MSILCQTMLSIDCQGILSTLCHMFNIILNAIDYHSTVHVNKQWCVSHEDKALCNYFI